jgi:hypothetical protein
MRTRRERSLDVLGRGRWEVGGGNDGIFQASCGKMSMRMFLLLLWDDLYLSLGLLVKLRSRSVSWEEIIGDYGSVRRCAWRQVLHLTLEGSCGWLDGWMDCYSVSPRSFPLNRQ